jgi:hypothetical protein
MGFAYALKSTHLRKCAENIFKNILLRPRSASFDKGRKLPTKLVQSCYEVVRSWYKAGTKFVQRYHNGHKITMQLLKHVAFIICGWPMFLKEWVANAFKICAAQCF